MKNNNAKTMTRNATNNIKAIFQHGKIFAISAVLGDFLDEILIPGILFVTGHTYLSGIALLGDLDWLTYPIIFVMIKTIKKLTHGGD